jgi:hypothetical protein
MSAAENGHGRGLVRSKEARRQLACGKTTLQEKYVKTGRLTVVPIGERSIAFIQAQLDTVIAEEIAASESISRKITARDITTGKFTSKKMKETRPA